MRLRLGRVHRGRLTLLCAVLALSAAACAGPQLAGPGRGGPGVLVIVSDALRADRLSMNGYSRPTSPNIDAFAAGADVYPRAWSTSSWTIPAHGSLFTGLYPFEHGAHIWRVEEEGGDGGFVVNRLSEEHLTLAEAFREEGYRTAAFIGNAGHLAKGSQMGQGFDLYCTEKLWAPELDDKVLDWIDAGKGRPFFAFINWRDTHAPFNRTPQPRVVPPASDEDEDEEDAGDEGDEDGEDAPRRRARRGERGEERIRALVDRYDVGVANMDQAFGELMQALDERGLLERTLVVLTADHGEFLGEWGLVSHGKELYEVVTRVPLIVRRPGQAEGRVVEVAATLADVPGLVAAGLPGPLGERMAARFPHLPGSRPVISQIHWGGARTTAGGKQVGHAVDGEVHPRFGRVRTALWEWPWKLVRSTDGEHELYDLSADPAESDNLYDARRDVADRMTAVLERWEEGRAAWPGPPVPIRLDEEDIKRLKSLGYVGP